ncbi:MAG: tetratricopeptide repeat protein [Pseudomonadota bacterium]
MLRRNSFLIFLALTIGILSCGGNKALLKKQSEASRLLAEAYYVEGKITEALQELLQAEKFYSKDPILHNDFGLVYTAKIEYEKALFHFKKALELNPQYPEAFNNMGIVYSILKQWDKAIECFDRARSDLLYKTPHIALSNLGSVYYEKGDYNRSVQFYKEALKVVPQLARADQGLGRTYIAMGKYEEAVFSLEKAVKGAPNFAAAYYDLGQAYLKLQSFEKALSAFKKVLELTSDGELNAKARDAIHELNR